MTAEALLGIQLLTRQMEGLQAKLNDALVKQLFPLATEYATQIAADAKLIAEKIGEATK